MVHVSIVVEVMQKLLQRHETLAVAESCTGGGLAYNIVQVPGVSSVFLGGTVVYANSAKERILSVPRSIIEQRGAVSQEVALLMADGCKKVFGSDWALSTTGIAGPTGGSKEKPVGLVWIGLVGPKLKIAKDYIFADISRIEHQSQTIDQAMMLLKSNISY
jgi:PncC family amidohydrolase